MADEEFPVGRMPGRGRAEWGWRLWIGGTVVVALATMARHWADPETRPWALGLLATFVVVFASLLNLDTWVDTRHGRLRHRRAWLVRWDVVWAETTVLRFRSNHLGMIVLQARSRGRRRSIHVPVVADDERGCAVPAAAGAPTARGRDPSLGAAPPPRDRRRARRAGRPPRARRPDRGLPGAAAPHRPAAAALTPGGRAAQVRRPSGRVAPAGPGSSSPRRRAWC